MQLADPAIGKFETPADAGARLAQALIHHRSAERTLVLAIVRGGVPVATRVARDLELPLDLVVLRALFQKSDASVIRVARVAGALSQIELAGYGMPSAGTVEAGFVADALRALALREMDCRGLRALRPIDGLTVILVDNGMRTGGTMLTAIGAVRDLGAAKVVVATPVSASPTLQKVQSAADETVCLGCPDPFIHVGLWYRQFTVPTEREIAAQLQNFETVPGIDCMQAPSMPA